MQCIANLKSELRSYEQAEHSAYAAIPVPDCRPLIHRPLDAAGRQAGASEGRDAVRAGGRARLPTGGASPCLGGWAHGRLAKTRSGELLRKEAAAPSRASSTSGRSPPIPSTATALPTSGLLSFFSALPELDETDEMRMDSVNR